MKLNNKVLIILVAVLLAFVLYTQFGNNKQGTFNKTLFALDTAKVTSLAFYPDTTAAETQMEFTREGNEWLLTTDSINAQTANPDVVKSLLNMLAMLEAKRLAAAGKDKWNEYEVGENGRHIIAKNGNQVLLNLYIGKFNISNPENQTGNAENMNPYQAQQRPVVTSYIRLAKDDKVYAVEGMLKAIFNRNPAEFLQQKPETPPTSAADSIPQLQPIKMK
ncbi:DUF4340 domain-containing protein [Sphingobacteriales bacterium UPWRP_1]|nr:hypothetical protein B6N25_06520 [Sphingobacteriales bacterium TSM_CSS]PSJ75476.1 DUF4340 domain-containing protein [Sphingobacteriales bacterium UPWRP_1]